MDVFENRFRANAEAIPALTGIPAPSSDAAAPIALIRRCPDYAETPLRLVPEIARHCGVGEVWVKDERGRMGLGSFKALGAAFVIAHDAGAGQAAGRTYVTASAGNHGLSVAAGARVFGADAVVFVAETVPEAFAERLRRQGAQVVREGATYEDSMAAAATAASEKGWVLLSDSSWPGYTERPHRLMQGYLVLMEEIFARCDGPPSHIFLQAGVGGLAGAAAAASRNVWGGWPRIIVVEPDAAPALAASVAAGAPVRADGPVSDMGRLDCKEPSLIALKGLARDADYFATISEAEGAAGADLAAGCDLPTTPSGAAGLAGLLAAGSDRGLLELDKASRVLLILSEGPEA